MVSLTLNLPDVPGLKVQEQDFQAVTNYPNKPMFRKYAPNNSLGFFMVTVDKTQLKQWLQFKRRRALTRKHQY